MVTVVFLVVLLLLLCTASIPGARAAIPAHRVTAVPTFGDKIPFEYYSGYLTVDGPFLQNPCELPTASLIPANRGTYIF